MLTVHLGEVTAGGRIDRDPGGSRRYRVAQQDLLPSSHDDGQFVSLLVGGSPPGGGTHSTIRSSTLCIASHIPECDAAEPGKLVLLELLDEVHADGAATLVATHDPTYVDRVERSIALRDGEVIFDGDATVDQVLALVGG